MYLSRVMLDPLAKRVRKGLADPRTMHRIVNSAFPAGMNGWERVLWRQETQGHVPFLLVQSLVEKPDWSSLPDECLYRDRLNLNPELKTFGVQLRPQQVLRFRLRANPTVKRNGKREGLYRESEQLAWIQRKSTDNGFRLVDVRMQARKIEVAGDAPLCLLAVQFDGILQVLDPDKVLNALRRGIGPAKAFGLGLLSLSAG